MSAPSRTSSKVTAAKFGALGLAAVALGCAALAAFFVGNLLTAKGYTGERVAPVVVAKTNLPAARPLGPDDLAVVNWPEASVPPGAYSTIEAVFAADPRPVPSVGILAGEPVVASRLSIAKAGTGIARLVRPNMRAVALKVDDSVGYTGLVYPGAYVDVIVTIRDPMGRGPASRISVQNARVLTVGADTDVATRRPPQKTSDRISNQPAHAGTYVTLEVTPEEAEILAIARNEGEVDLALRNGADNREVDTTGATAHEIAYGRDAEPEAQTAPAHAARTRRTTAKPRRARRRIQIVASDDPDQPAAKAPAKIETHYAN